MRRHLVTLLCVLTPSVAFAWNAAGHMTQAALAWRVLSPSEQAWVDTILRAHPQAVTWDTERARSRSTVEPAAYRFLRASVWADEIKRTEHVPDRSSWHFANYPLESAVSPVEPDPGAPHNIVAGLLENEAVVADPHAAPKDRAIALAFVIHLLGDLHQPLHCATAISRVHRAPAGDRGGLDTLIRLKTKSTLKDVLKGKASLREYWKGKLAVHEFWDTLFGKSRDPADAMASAIQLEEKGIAGGPANDDETATALASRQLAQTVAYPPGAWVGKGDDVHVDEAYVQAARSTGDQQLVASARQLDTVLRRLMKPAAVVAPPPPVPPQQQPLDSMDVPAVAAAQEVHEDRLLIKVIVGVIVVVSGLWLGLALVVRQRQ